MAGYLQRRQKSALDLLQPHYGNKLQPALAGNVVAGQPVIHGNVHMNESHTVSINKSVGITLLSVDQYFHTALSLLNRRSIITAPLSSSQQSRDCRHGMASTCEPQRTAVSSSSVSDGMTQEVSGTMQLPAGLDSSFWRQLMIAVANRMWVGWPSTSRTQSSVKCLQSMPGSLLIPR